MSPSTRAGGKFGTSECSSGTCLGWLEKSESKSPADLATVKETESPSEKWMQGISGGGGVMRFPAKGKKWRRARERECLRDGMRKEWS